MTATVAQNPADIGATGLKLMVDAEKSGKVIPVSYTHLDVYKIQGSGDAASARYRRTA